MYLDNIIVGHWNDPHMLAGFMASFCHATASNGPPNDFEATRGRDAWAHFAVTGAVTGINVNLTTLAGMDLVMGGDELAGAVVAWKRRTDELHAQFRAYDREGNRIPHVVCRQSIRATTRMFATTWGNPSVWYSETMLWLGRTWRYADIVAPWRPVTEDAIAKPRKFCRPVPSPIPTDVKAAIDACLMAGEPEAAKSYYQSWRDVQALQEKPCEP